jgi:arylsulfatase
MDMTTNGHAAASQGPVRRPHVVLFICDQMQYQRQGKVDPQARTPNLDRFADENVFFTHFHAANGQCVPSRVAMQTGLYPHEAGVMIIYGFHGHTAHLTGEQRTVGHVFRAAGYTTAFFGKTHFGTPLANLGYEHGWEGPRPGGGDESEGPRGAAANRSHRRNSLTDRAIVDRALEFLTAHDPAQPLFLTVSIHEPHPPFEVVEAYADLFNEEEMRLPRSFYEDDLSGKPAFQREHARDGRHGYPDAGPAQAARARAELRRYYTMVSHVDQLFGEVRAALEGKGMWDGAAVAFTADHGDMMAAHRMRLKGTVPYEEIFRIPFVLKLPGGAPAPVRRTVDDLAVNVAQPGTLVESAGLPVPPELRGGSLVPLLYRERRPEQETLFYEHYGAYWGLHPFRVVRVRDPQRGEWKLARYYGPAERIGPGATGTDGAESFDAELYDLANDPDELHNRARDPELAEWRAELLSRVDEWWQRTGGRDFAYYESDEFKLSGAATLKERT